MKYIVIDNIKEMKHTSAEKCVMNYDNGRMQVLIAVNLFSADQKRVAL